MHTVILKALLVWGLILLPALTANVQARDGGDIHRCVAEGAVRYQDRPCAVDEAGGRWRPHQRDAATPQAKASSRAPRRAATSRKHRARRQARGQAALITLQRDPDACKRMQHLREEALRRSLRRPDYLMQRGWDDRVREACR